MPFDIRLSSDARRDIQSLRVVDRRKVLDALDTYLRYEPTKESKSRIKRLRKAEAAEDIEIMKTINITDLQHDTAHYIELAEEEDIIILKDGKPVGLLRGFTEADDLFDYHIETHPLFIERVRRARKEYLAGKSVRLEDIRDELLSVPDQE